MESKKELTKRLYWHDTYLFEHDTKVVEIGKTDELHWVRTSETIFHPQGGGQPSDEGTINNIKVVKLEELKEAIPNAAYDMAVITHFLEKDPGVKVGDIVKLAIDKEKRLQHSALHTAGHVIAGVMRTKFKYMQQTGANHFPGAAKVEFKKDGTDFGEREIEALVHDHLESNKKVIEDFSDVPEIYRAPNRGSQARCITIDGLWKEPCSGTHLKSLSEIGQFSVRNKKEAKDNKVGIKLTVGYDSAFGMFKRPTNVVPAAASASAKNQKEVVKFNKTFETPNGIKIIFNIKGNDVRAIIKAPDKAEQTISGDDIHINLHDDPQDTIKLNSQRANWQIAALERVADVSLAFSGIIVITKLNDWSFESENKKASAPSPKP